MRKTTFKRRGKAMGKNNIRIVQPSEYSCTCKRPMRKGTVSGGECHWSGAEEHPCVHEGNSQRGPLMCRNGGLGLLTRGAPHTCLWIAPCSHVRVSLPCGTLGSPCQQAHSCLLVSAQHLCLVMTAHPHVSRGQEESCMSGFSSAEFL